MTLKGGTSQACAACKYQRRRCTSECPLAPYFPPDQPKVFQNAHRLFGVSNILKILKKLDGPEQKATAMWSIIYQSNERDRDPVHGCLGRISQLRYQIWQSEQELLSLHHRLQILKSHSQAQSQAQQQHQPLDLIMGPPSGPTYCHDNNDLNLVVDAVTNDNENNNSDGGVIVDDVNSNGMWLQYNPNSSGNYESAIVVPAQDYDEMPFFDTMDDRQSYNIDSKEAYDSSNFIYSFSSEESVIKVDANHHTTIDHLVDNELKNAAAGLSLTSVN